MKIEMVVIENKNVIKREFDVINKDGIISFNLNKLTFALRVDDLKKVMGG
jgi:hypothetical protein